MNWLASASEAAAKKVKELQDTAMDSFDSSEHLNALIHEKNIQLTDALQQVQTLKEQLLQAQHPDKLSQQITNLEDQLSHTEDQLRQARDACRESDQAAIRAQEAKRASDEAAAKAEEKSESLEAKQSKLKTLLTKLHEAKGLLVAERDELKKQLADKQGQVEDSEKAAGEQLFSTHEFESRIEASERERDEAVKCALKYTKEVEDLKGELESLKKSFQESSTVSAHATGDGQGDVATIVEGLNQTKADLTMISNEKDKNLAELTESQAESDSMRKEINMMRRDLEAAHAEVDRLTTGHALELSRLSAEHASKILVSKEEANEALSDALKRADEAETQIAVERERVAQLQEEVADQNKRLIELTSRADTRGEVEQLQSDLVSAQQAAEKHRLAIDTVKEKSKSFIKRLSDEKKQLEAELERSKSFCTELEERNVRCVSETQIATETTMDLKAALGRLNEEVARYRSSEGEAKAAAAASANATKVAEARVLEEIARGAEAAKKLEKARAELENQRQSSVSALEHQRSEAEEASQKATSSSLRIEQLAEQVESLERALEVAQIAAREDEKMKLNAAREENVRMLDEIYSKLEDEKAARKVAEKNAEKIQKKLNIAVENCAKIEESLSNSRATEKTVSATLAQVQVEAARLRSENEISCASVEECKNRLNEELQNAQSERIAHQGVIENLNAEIERLRGETMRMAESGNGSVDQEIDGARSLPAEEELLRSILSRPDPPTSNPPKDDVDSLFSSVGGDANGTVEKAAAEAAAAIAEVEEENSFLKYELAELQAALKRSSTGVSLHFLKNVIVRFMINGDLDNSLPVIAKALKLSDSEVEGIRLANRRGLLSRFF